MKTIINTKKINCSTNQRNLNITGICIWYRLQTRGHSQTNLCFDCVWFSMHLPCFAATPSQRSEACFFFFPLRVACLSAVVKITTFRICNFLFWKMQGYMYWSIFVEKVKHPRITHKKISSQVNLLESAPERCKKINRNQNGLLDTSRWTWLLKVHQDAWPQNSQISRFLYKPFSPAIF